MNDRADARVHALNSSVERLRALVGQLGPSQLEMQSYASKWSIADVLSHIGSGAVIMRNGIDIAVSGQPVDTSFNQSVWDEWNAKAPSAKASDALAADQALVERLAALTASERGTLVYALGPMQIDFETLVGLRLNEHVLHSWDISVALDPEATLPPDATAVVIDNLELISRFASRSDGVERTIKVRTSDPERLFAIVVGDERAPVTASPESTDRADVELPAESFIRLIYGRLDLAEPRVPLDQLRPLFPGF